MQAKNCNAQIPAKVYEYLRARRPLLCLSDPAGDTMGLVRAAGVETLARLDDAADIAKLLRRFLTAGGREHALPDASAVLAASRRSRSEQLAALLNELTQSQPSTGSAARQAHR